ncbi:hypothetical protein TSAR_009989 [Trichomalopsis sarcophagae]|uniref:Uncharacterized protein n=1 Tax=Trichomalopsis sarcophagae TaxID=543379 RepID=A0A232FBX4_9HYME|nr:hypothetical protein TSAR_009989 [Trichomalopsis sarcophagae]
MSKTDPQALLELRTECDLVYLLLAKANPSLALELRQRRSPPIANAATQTSTSAPGKQRIDGSAAPAPQPRPDNPESSSVVLNAKWPEHLELVDILARPSAHPDLRALLPRFRTTPTAPTQVAATPPTMLQIISRKIAAKQAAQPGPRKTAYISPRKRKQPAGKPSPMKQRPTAPRPLGQRRKPRIISNRILETPLLLPSGKMVACTPLFRVPLVEEKTLPEPTATVTVNPATSD